MIRKILLTMIVLCVGLNLSAQTLNVEDGKTYHWETDFLVGLNNDGWQAEFGCAYFPLQYVGLKANIGFAGEIKEFADWGLDDEQTRHDYYFRFKFIPSLVLRTPSIATFGIDSSLYLFAEGGMILSPGASGSKDAKTCCWDAKCGINYQKGRVILFAGYGITNYKLLSGIIDDDKLTHSGFIGTAYKF